MKKYVQSPQRGGKKEKKAPRILYLAKLCFRKEKKIKSFQDKQKLKEFVTPGLALEEMLKGVLHTEIKTLLVASKHMK